jgi:molybdate transport system substrate-binding protein
VKPAILRLLIAFVFLAASLSIPSPVSARGGADEKVSKEITVAAAADLSVALKEIAANYEKQSGVQVKLSFAASGALTQQIQNGAPFDVFFSADMDYPRQLVASNDADASSLYRYAVGALVLWAPTSSPLDPEHQRIKVLSDPSVKKIAIANPQHAPYGRAAVAALKQFGIYEQVQDRLVMGENISQAAQFVESGNAQVGFIALAHAVPLALRGEGKFWKVPAEAYPALDQGVVVVSHSPHKREAAAFVDYIKTKDAADVLRRYGFTVP